jgi:photosystem II stability/assembly factor-like uncharacterized protein
MIPATPRLRSITLVLLFAFAALGHATGPSMPGQFERVGPFGGDVRSLLINPLNPDLVYLGTSDGQLFKSLNGGESWTFLYPGIGRRKFVIDTLVHDPVDPGRLFAGAWDLQSRGGGLFESQDSGASWSAVALPQSTPAIRDFAISAKNPEAMIAGTLDGAYVTGDGGKTWRRTTANSGGFHHIESVAIHPVDPRVLFVGTWRLAHRSGDSGRSWIRINSGMLYDSDVFSLAIDPRNPGVMFAGACSGIYRSTNRGSVWTRLKILPDRFGVRAHVVLVDPVDSKRIYGGTTEGLFISQDGGKTWKRSTRAGVVVHAIQVDPRNSRRILLGTEAQGVLRSEDGGRTWQDSNTGFVHRQISRIVADPDHSGRFLAGVLSDGRHGGIYSFEHASGYWNPQPGEGAPEAPILALLPLPESTGRIAGTAQGLYHQTSGAARWSKVPGAISRSVVRDLAMDSSGKWIFAATNWGVLRSRLADLKFEAPADKRFQVRVSSLAASRTAPGSVYAGTSFGVLHSRDYGASWDVASRGLPGRASIECLASCPAESGHLLAGTAAGLYQSRDHGRSWEKEMDGRLGVDISSIIFPDPAGRKIMAADATFGGVFFSADDGSSWSRIDAPEFGSPVRHLAWDPVQPFLVYLGTNSDGVYRLRLNTNLTN